MAKASEVQKGKKLKVVSNGNSHNYRVGGIYTISSIDLTRGTCRATDEDGVLGNNLAFDDFVLYSVDYESILSKKIQLLEELDEVEKKLKWMEENEALILHEKSFQVQGIVESLQGKTEKEMFTLINALLG